MIQAWAEQILRKPQLVSFWVQGGEGNQVGSLRLPCFSALTDSPTPVTCFLSKHLFLAKWYRQKEAFWKKNAPVLASMLTCLEESAFQKQVLPSYLTKTTNPRRNSSWKFHGERLLLSPHLQPPLISSPSNVVDKDWVATVFKTPRKKAVKSTLVT